MSNSNDASNRRVEAKTPPCSMEDSTCTTYSEHSSVTDVAVLTASPIRSEAPPAKDSLPHHFVIEEWRAVLGDKHCSNTGRSTTATKILKQVKKDLKKMYSGKHRKNWYSEANDKYHELMARRFPEIPDQDRGRVIIQCTHKCWKVIV